MNYQDSGCVIFQDQIKPADVSVKIEADNTSFMEKNLLISWLFYWTSSAKNIL